jgi:superfamily II DNA/RNA helicase
MTTFADLGLSPATVQAVIDSGYTQPTPIQEQAIPVAMAGRDVLGIAQTGTGKTAAFTLPMIDRMAAGRAKARMPRALVIAPTRELADQVAASFEKYAKGTKLSWALLIGGVSFADQERKLDRGVDVLIATPGRLLDHFERGKLLMTGVQTMVVDEADRMLDMGFIPDLERIFNLTPKTKQTLFFSATMPPEITRLTAQFLKDPTRIEVARPATTGENIKQFVANVKLGDPKSKRTVLRKLIERAAPESGIVFCNRKTEVDIVAKSLRTHGFDASPIHGDLDQSQRTKTLEAFRKGELKLLVASDVAARGLDIPAVSHIFNFDVPHHAEDYVHRIGRTGRAGRSGEAFTIVGPNDGKGWDKVLKLTKKEPEEITVEIDWDEAAKAAERDRDRYGNSKDRAKREGRDRNRDNDRSRPIKDHGERASMAPLTPDLEARPAETTEEAAPAVERERRPRRERAPRNRGESTTRNADSVESSPAETTRSERPERSERQERAARSERAERPERAERAERSERPERSEARPRRSESAAPASQPARRADSEPRDDHRGRRGERDEPSVVGFGSDTPAFLLRAAPLAPLKPSSRIPAKV